jgi:hypothetical protein
VLVNWLSKWLLVNGLVSLYSRNIIVDLKEVMMDRKEFCEYMRDIEVIVKEMMDSEYDEGFDDGYDRAKEEEDNDGRDEV